MQIIFATRIELMMAWTHFLLAWSVSSAPLKPEPWMEQQIEKQLQPIRSTVSIENVQTSFSGVVSTYRGEYAPIIWVQFDGKDVTWTAPKMMDDALKARAETFCEAIQVVHMHGALLPFECLVCLEDQCEKPLYLKRLKAPVFCISKSRRNNHILLVPKGLFDKQQSIPFKDVAAKSLRTPWKHRLQKALWRPATVPDEYLYNLDEVQPSWRLLLLGQAYPETLDIRLGQDINFSKIPWSASHIIQYENFSAPYLAPMQQINYRYLIAGDQLGRLHDLEWQLFSGSVVLKAPAQQTEWFHSQLRPYHHYIPISLFGEDLVERVEALGEMDEEAQQIAHQALLFAQKTLGDQGIFNYFSHLLHRYVSLLYETP